jgi:2',3'-cyclic-nucleotide 2'-phosphodiesterase (5'-nucleotidase family)
MVETELNDNMKKLLFIFIAALLSLHVAFGQEYEWRVVPMDASRTGCTTPSADNVETAIGYFKGGKYVAPDGKVYGRNSIVAKTARAVLDAQPKMARVKEVIAYSTSAMEAHHPESALSNWFIDLLMEQTEKLSGKKVDMGITNFGGIRIDMPEGPVILDDMLSMFPFKNHLVYVEHKGSQIRKILEKMAAGRIEVLGGARIVVEDGKLVSAEIGGKPIDDNKIYGLVTISFLLSGGDGLSLAENAVSVTEYKDVMIIDAVLEHVRAETAAGRPISGQEDGRVVIKGGRRR